MVEDLSVTGVLVISNSSVHFCCSALWIQLIEALLVDADLDKAAENVVALCLAESLSQGVVQVQSQT